MVFLNGRFLSEAEARISAFDAGFQHGVGLFETVAARLEGGRAEVVRLEEHLERLLGSARELGLSGSLRKHALAEAVGQTVERAGHPRARVRLTVSGGDLNLLQARHEGTRLGGQAPAQVHEGKEKAGNGDGAGAPAQHAKGGGIDPTVMIAAQPATEYPPEMFERGVTVVIADWRVNPLDPMAGHKTLNYWGRLRELQSAAARRAGEALVFQVTNHLAGGCVSNAFVVKGGRLLTPIARGEEESAGSVESPKKRAGPVLSSPVLPGITRGAVMAWAAERALVVERRMLTIDDVLGADELFLTNSSFGVLPVAAVEREKIGAGTPGEITRACRAALESP